MTVFESTHPFAFFDYLRIPYCAASEATDPRIGTVRAVDSGKTLCWSRAGGSVGRYRLGDFSLVGHVLGGVPPVAAGDGIRAWQRTEDIRDPAGRHVASVWEDAAGNVFLPFDPGEVMTYLWSERYTAMGRAGITRSMRTLVLRSYYAVRPLLPRPLQLRMRRIVAKHQTPPDFPAWPTEHSLQNFYRWLLALVARLADEPVPWIDLWPDGKTWAMVLTHDVENAAKGDEIELLRGVERELGYRSSWNFVPERYATPAELIAWLKAEGCEVGVHGLRHDGRDVASRRMLRRRLPAMRAHAERWGATGFRSPATQRRWDLMPTMGFDHDSSYTDSDPYEPQPGGCCTYLPFFNDGLVELPITLPQDHTLFEILQHSDGTLWVTKAREIRERRGMVLALAHPDYAHDQRVVGAWRQLLAEFAHDEDVWQALPSEVASWWRHRDASTVRRTADGWTLDGPASERARVRVEQLAGS